MKKGIPSFLTGFLAAALAFSLGLSAMAASGQVSFDSVSLILNGKTIYSEGESLNTTEGELIPSSIMYTDGMGGGTTYLPIRTLADMLSMPIKWDSGTNSVIIGKGRAGITVESKPSGSDDSLDRLPLDCAGSTVAPFSEVAPMKQNSGIFLLQDTKYLSASNFARTLPFMWENGHYLSITVENHGDHALLFQLGRQYTVGRELFATQIPAGATVTRTFEMAEIDDILTPQFVVDISTGEADNQKVDISISAVQFDK